MAITFLDWLIQQMEREDIVGEFARYVFEDSENAPWGTCRHDPWKAFLLERFSREAGQVNFRLYSEGVRSAVTEFMILIRQKKEQDKQIALQQAELRKEKAQQQARIIDEHSPILARLARMFQFKDDYFSTSEEPQDKVMVINPYRRRPTEYIHVDEVSVSEPDENNMQVIRIGFKDNDQQAEGGGFALCISRSCGEQSYLDLDHYRTYLWIENNGTKPSRDYKSDTESGDVTKNRQRTIDIVTEALVEPVLEEGETDIE